MKNILIFLALHWVFDFVCQTDKMAQNKSKSNYWLTIHVAVYSVGLLWMAFLVDLSSKQILWFWLANSALHWGTDWCTSRFNSYLWRTEQRHWFFVSIGFDQLLHYATLLLTYDYLKS